MVTGGGERALAMGATLVVHKEGGGGLGGVDHGANAEGLDEDLVIDGELLGAHTTLVLGTQGKAGDAEGEEGGKGEEVGKEYVGEPGDAVKLGGKDDGGDVEEDGHERAEGEEEVEVADLCFVGGG
jgi:hypothetical protein